MLEPPRPGPTTPGPSPTLPKPTPLHPGSGELPGWESFPAPDRQRLILLLVQTARRQVRGRPTARCGGGRG